MQRRHAIAIMLACVLLCTSHVAYSQEAPAGGVTRPHPLLALLALTPDQPFVAQGTPFLRYIDYDAVREARPAVSPAAVDPAFDDAGLCWLSAENDAAVLYHQPGIAPGQIERALAFGAPPASGMILEGDFDAVALAQTLDASGYAQRDEQGILLLQPEAEIDGDRWRDSVALAGRYLMRTPKAPLLEALVNTYIGYRQSLYTRPAVLALAEALSRQPGDMLSAEFFTSQTAQSGLPKSTVTLFEPGENGLAARARYYDDGDWLAVFALVYEAQISARLAARMLTEEMHATAQQVEGIRVEPPLVYASPGGDYFVALARARHRQSVCGPVAGPLSEEAQP